MCVTYVHESMEVRRGIGYLGTEVKDDCELPRGCWELNSGLSQDQ